MEYEERTVKRRRVTASSPSYAPPASSSSSVLTESYKRGYLTLAQAEILIAPEYDLLLTDTGDVSAPVTVNIKAYSGASRIQLTSQARKALPTFTAIYAIPDEVRQLLDDCIKLESVLKYEKDSPACPIACHHATVKFTPTPAAPTAYTLAASIVWLDNAEARDNVKDEHWGLWNTYFLDKSLMQTTRHEPWDTAQFYESVHVPERRLQDTTNMSINLLLCKLYPFQERAVRWLLSRENVAVDQTGHTRALSSTKTLPANFHQTTDLNGHTCYVNHALGVASSSGEEIRSRYRRVKGGILAEEMGLGKTVELIALMCLHRRMESPIYATQDLGDLAESPATLIITPPTILQQWIQELKQHSPALRVYHYEGINTEARRHTGGLQNEDTAAELVSRLADNDVVVTTYNVIAKEVHYVEAAPDRNLRRKKPVYERPKSPLTQISWWRVCLDEAQKVETGVSNAAIVARRIPRINAWAVSGTPLKKDHKDLYGLLLFLHYEPWCNSQRSWDRLVTFHRPLFRALMGEIAIRHSKDLVRDDLRLPPQSRHTITIPFTAIEEQYYGQMFSEMCESVGLDGKGAPLNGDWDPSSLKVAESMRQWLTRLRQVCLHPEVGGRNRRALGLRSGGPLRTVLQVLDVMIDQNDVEVRAEQRALLMSQIRRGQLFENAKDTNAAMIIWQAAYDDSCKMVDECRAESNNARDEWLQNKQADEASNVDTDDEDDDKHGDNRMTTCRQRLRSALEMKHVCIFFLGNCYFQLKSDEEHVQPDSQAFKQLDKQEEEAYEEAKGIRSELMMATLKKANRFMDTVKKDAQQGLVHLPDVAFDLEYSGIESRKVFDKLHHFCEAMNVQANQYRRVRQKMVEFLAETLIDADEDVELKGDEYESSTKHQDEMYAYMELLRALFADRGDAVTGQENILIKHEMKTLQRSAKEGEGPAPELMIKLLADRAQHRIPSELGSLRGIVSEVRSLVTSLQWQEGDGSTRARAELGIAEGLLKQCQKLLAAQNKAVGALEQEVARFRDTMNNRLEYYRALQKLSDTVAPFEEENIGKPLDNVRLDNILYEEERKSTKLSNLMAKRRYLIHLKAESTSEATARICIICQSGFELGTLTVCGHQFCKECIQLWYAERKNCPVCKRHLRGTDFWDVTYKPQELAIQQEIHPIQLSSSLSAEYSEHSASKSIYSSVSNSTLNEIKCIDLNGASFGSKVDTICRHILWLRDHDAGSKAIIFSQYREFLEVLGRAFKQSKIAWTRFDERNGIEKFKGDPAIECFLLDAKAQSAGLNLVVANHVFLCEPLINTAIELQAIARVHRIGQQRATTVWMYLVADSVEETIHEISVDRRLEHIKGKSSKRSKLLHTSSRSGTATPTSVLENQIDAANTLELQAADLSKLLTTGKSGGELVEERDLWQCLFRRPRQRETGMAQEAANRANGEVERFLRAEAAEGRASAVQEET